MSTVILFNQYRWIIFCCRDGLMFSWPNKWEHASFGPNKRSVELAQRNLADLHCKFFMQHQNKKISSPVKKNLYRPASIIKKKLLNVCWKISVGATSRPMSAIEFSIQSVNKFAWCRLGKVRSASSCEASFLDLDRSCFLADVDCHFFRSISVNNIFLPWWANVFLIE